jgi:5-methylcytosine-specific restriction endonuclease McrA
VTSALVCKHCGRRYRRSKNRAFGRTFCSKKCFWSGQRITVYEIWRRDKGECHLCGRYCSLEDASRDHVKPRYDGGRTTWENIKLAHRNCNSRRGHMPVKEYKAMWERLLEEQDRKKREREER